MTLDSATRSADDVPGSGIPGAAPAMEVEHIDVGYDQRVVLRQIDLAVATGGVTCLVGPNGSGKSTLLKACARLLAAKNGTIRLNGDALGDLSSREVGRRLAILPQSAVTPESLTVHELVEQGRYPHAGPLRMLRRQDHEAVRWAISATGLEAFADRDVAQLSGGERQRAWIALALAQGTPLLFLDEPTTFLDIGYQLEVLHLVQMLNRDHGITVVMVLHDLNQAAAYADRIVCLHRGAIVADGAPGEVITPELLQDVFRVEASIVTDPVSGRPVFLPHNPVGAAAAALGPGDGG